MKNHNYCEYRNDDEFLRIVEKYVNEYDHFDDIKEAIRNKVDDWIYNSHGSKYDEMMYFSEAKSLLNVLEFINNHRDEE